MTSLAQWVTDQITDAVRPIADTITRDIARRLRVHITVTFDLDDEHT